MAIDSEGTTTFISSVNVEIDFEQVPILVSCPPVAEMYSDDFACSFASIGGTKNPVEVT